MAILLYPRFTIKDVLIHLTYGLYKYETRKLEGPKLIARFSQFLKNVVSQKLLQYLTSEKAKTSAVFISDAPRRYYFADLILFFILEE